MPKRHRRHVDFDLVISLVGSKPYLSPVKEWVRVCERVYVCRAARDKAIRRMLTHPCPDASPVLRPLSGVRRTGQPLRRMSSEDRSTNQ